MAGVLQDSDSQFDLEVGKLPEAGTPEVGTGLEKRIGGIEEQVQRFEQFPRKGW